MFKKLVGVVVWLLCAIPIFTVSSVLYANTPCAKFKTVSPVKVLVWGDSLSAAYGIPVADGWVSLLQKTLGGRVEISNASISGETTQGGLTRLPAALKRYQPDILLLELGANDGLRGISLKIMRENLRKMIELAQQQGATVILLGMKLPPNYGLQYTHDFEQVFAGLASRYALGFVPFLLEKVALQYEMMQADGLHPNSKAQPLILQQVLPVLKQQLDCGTD